VEEGSERGSQATNLPRKRSAEERRALLSQAVADEKRDGWQLESQEDFDAVMVKRRRGMYLLQLLFTVLMSPQAESVGGDKREIVSVDEYGDIDIVR
jgi:hypothetical protein